MVELISKIISNVLTALYQPFWFSLLSAVLCLFFYLFVKEHGWKEAIRRWIVFFKTSVQFRRLFCLAFFVMMILMRTLLNRNMWVNPVSNVLDGWTLYNEEGELTTEAIENVMLMLPFIVLLLWTFRDRLLDKVSLGSIVWTGAKFSFLFSVCIEFLQLFLRLGTFQLSDIFYNTLGGLLGGVIYYIGYKMKHEKENANKKHTAKKHMSKRGQSDENN